MNTPSTGRLEFRDAAGTVVGYYLPAAELARMEAELAALRLAPPTPPPPRTGPYADLTDEQVLARLTAPALPADEKARLLAELDARRGPRFAAARRETDEIVANHPASKLSPEEWIARWHAWCASRPSMPPGHRIDSSRETLYGDDER